MLTRTLVGHLKICDGSILWADEDAHTLLDYPSGALTDMPFDDVLPPASANELKLPARGAVDGRRVVLRARHGHTIMADLRGERMDDRCVLWSFTPTARGVRGERLDLLSRHDALTRLPNSVPSGAEEQTAGPPAA